MEGFNPEYDVVFDANTARANAAAPPLRQPKKKKSGAFGIFRAALYMLRKSTDEKEAAAAAAKKAAAAAEEKSNNGDWKKIVGSMRPLHAQEAPASPMYMMSPAASDGASSSSGTMSQYASATNLRDLCNCEDESEDPDEVFDAITGDEEIDSKAEEFIAQFYKQIHHQNSIHRQDRGV